MAVEGIHSQVYREAPVEPKLKDPEIIEQLRHGNIYEILRSHINAEDFNKFISYRGRLFENSILQNYSVYADSASVPPPDFESHFAPHDVAMTMTSDDRKFFKDEMASLQNFEPQVREGGKVRFQAKAMTLSPPGGGSPSGPPGPGQDVASIAGEALGQWQDFFTSLQWKMIDAQMVEQMQSKASELNSEIQRIVSMVMSGQADPEYVLIAAAKSNMAQNGILFSREGKRIMFLNQQMDQISKQLYKMDPNDQGYFKELQMAQSQTRGMSTQMQLEMMDLQKFSQNIATTLDFANNAIRTFAQMRQTTTQAIAAR